MGFPPGNAFRIIPSTPPLFDPISWDWDELVRAAEANRPDIVERKLALEADAQQLLIAENTALPQVDASALPPERTCRRNPHRGYHFRSLR